MENHPIPQDITGFQFKLIGNMTIKQFVYLAVGAIFAWLFFFVFDFPAIIKFPLTIISFATGAIIAFVPIDGRPMDVMLKNFFRALVSPTEFIYQKEGGKLSDQDSADLRKHPIAINPMLPHSPSATGQADIVHDLSMPQQFTPQSSQTNPFTSSPGQTPPHHSLFGDFKDSLKHEKHEKNDSHEAKETKEKKEKESKEIKDIKKENTKLQEEIDEIKKSLEKSKASEEPIKTAPIERPSSPPPPPPPPTSIPGFAIPIGTPSIVSPATDDSRELEKKDEEIKEISEEKDKLQEEVDKLKKQLEEAIKEKEEAKAPPPPPPPPPPPQESESQQELEKKLIESNREKEALEKELVAIKSKPEKPKETFTPVVAKPLESTQRVRSVPFGMEKSVGIPSIPEDPNLITGIVKDPRGNPLQNILIEVKDQDSNPVRAFKTNGLGKFASATSLSNGKYVISFEDTGETHKFDAVELELIGAPVMPLEIISVDPRIRIKKGAF